MIEILEQSLYQHYLIDKNKFNVKKLIKKVDPELLKSFESKIKHKVNKENRSINRIFVDFGPYPLLKLWQISKEEKEIIENANLVEDDEDQNTAQRHLKKALVENQKNQNLFMAPDEDNYEQHGIKNLVIKYQEFSTTLEIDESIHKESPFYRINMLEGVLEEFLNKLNIQLEPIRD